MISFSMKRRVKSLKAEGRKQIRKMLLILPGGNRSSTRSDSPLWKASKRVNGKVIFRMDSNNVVTIFKTDHWLSRKDNDRIDLVITCNKDV